MVNHGSYSFMVVSGGTPVNLHTQWAASVPELKLSEIAWGGTVLQNPVDPVILVPLC